MVISAWPPERLMAYAARWCDDLVTHDSNMRLTVEPGGEEMACCGLTPAQWRLRGNTALSTTNSPEHVTCEGAPWLWCPNLICTDLCPDTDCSCDCGLHQRMPEETDTAWRVDVSQPKPDQIREEPLTESEVAHQAESAWQVKKDLARENIKAARKAAALGRLGDLAHDGDVWCQDILDLLEIAWRAEED